MRSTALGAFAPAPILLKSGKKIFNQMTSLVKMFIVISFLFSSLCGWNDNLASFLLKSSNHSFLGIIGAAPKEQLVALAHD